MADFVSNVIRIVFYHRVIYVEFVMYSSNRLNLAVNENIQKLKQHFTVLDVCSYII